MATISRPITESSVDNFMNKRANVPASAVGRKGTFLVQGKGRVVDMLYADGKPVPAYGNAGMVATKKIFNLRATSLLAKANERNNGYFLAGQKAEKLGKAIKWTIKDETREFTAHELFNAYLNSTQMSFSVPTSSPICDELDDNVEITAMVVLIKGENGDLLSIDPSTITFVKALTFETGGFNLKDFVQSDETPSAGAEPKPKRVRKAKVK